MFENINIILLAAGHSKRCWPLGDKNAFSVLGKPLLHFRLQQMSGYGFSQFILVADRTNAGFVRQCASGAGLGNFIVIEQKYPEGMAGAVKSALEQTDPRKGILIVSPTDIFDTILFDRFGKMLKSGEYPEGVIAGKTVQSYFPGGYITYDTSGVIRAITEKPAADKVSSDTVNIVFHYFRDGKRLAMSLETTKPSGNDDLYETAINRMIADGVKIRLLKYKEYWYPIKYPWHLLEVNTHYLGEIAETIIHNRGDDFISPTAVIRGKVIIEKGVRIHHHAKIIGPAYIGSDTVIGDNVLIRESSVGHGCTIGFSSEIARSHIGNNCTFHNNYVGDSIIADGVAMGAGAITANFRLDQGIISSCIGEKKVLTGRDKFGAVIGVNARIGVNTSLMPGIKIGRGTFIGSGLVLDTDIPDGKYCTVKNRYTVVDNITDRKGT